VAEGGARNIRANAIAWVVDTDMRQCRRGQGPMLSLDCVGLAVFLASDEARYITGQVIEIEWF
jgi:NAD(P)-dependent dehydrogenase (short-subunit alcohol dehydrogenase family)